MLGLAEKSRAQYVGAVEGYTKWCETMAKDKLNPEVVLEYLKHLYESDRYGAKSIWSISSMIGSFVETYTNKRPHEEFPLINKMIKQWEKKEEVKKAKTFEEAEVFKYLAEAPDDDFHLPRKVILILAINGLERKKEITFTTIDDLKFNLDCILVTLGRQKAMGSKTKSQFMITDVLMREKVSKYYNLFTEEDKKGNGRFLRKMVKGRITEMVMGENMVAKAGEDIAKWLGYTESEAKKFTSHCFRRTAATILAENGISHDALKIAGGWHSDRACGGYIENSGKMKRGIADMLARDVIATSNADESKMKKVDMEKTSYNFDNAQNCIFHFTIASTISNESDAKPSSLGGDAKTFPSLCIDAKTSSLCAEPIRCDAEQGQGLELKPRRSRGRPRVAKVPERAAAKAPKRKW